MKFTVMMKTPDALHESVCEALGRNDPSWHWPDHQDEINKLMDFAAKWFGFREYVTLELDTEEETCKVLGSSW